MDMECEQSDMRIKDHIYTNSLYLSWQLNTLQIKNVSRGGSSSFILLLEFAVV